MTRFRWVQSRNLLLHQTTQDDKLRSDHRFRSFQNPKQEKEVDEVAKNKAKLYCSLSHFPVANLPVKGNLISKNTSRKKRLIKNLCNFHSRSEEKS
jgi:hypothetical protein